MRTLILRAAAIAVVLGPIVAIAQGGKTKTATYITKEEIDLVNQKGQGTDRNIRTVDIGNENFSIGIIHRGKTVNGVMVPAAGATPNAAPAAARGNAPAEPCGRQMATPPPGGSAGGITHDSQTEGYYIVSGGGTMITDGYIVNGRHSPSPDLNGPTCGGMAYDVVKKAVKPGDIIIVPAGVVHGWIDIPEHVDYLSFRPSPGILTAGWVHPVLRK